jgi:hypothetical protein
MNKAIACSIEKAKQALGYLPAVALEEGCDGACDGWLIAVSTYDFFDFGIQTSNFLALHSEDSHAKRYTHQS